LGCSTLSAAQQERWEAMEALRTFAPRIIDEIIRTSYHALAFMIAEVSVILSAMQVALGASSLANIFRVSNFDAMLASFWLVSMFILRVVLQPYCSSSFQPLLLLGSWSGHLGTKEVLKKCSTCGATRASHSYLNSHKQ
jgi:hypothetical protein